MHRVPFHAILACLVISACSLSPTAPQTPPLMQDLRHVTVTLVSDSAPIDCSAPQARCEDTFEGFDALLVVDGIPLDEAEARCIDNADIESVQILKGSQCIPPLPGYKQTVAILVTTKSRRPPRCATP